MRKIPTYTQRNQVLIRMASLLETNKKELVNANADDLAAYKGGDLAMFDRLKVNGEKVQGMVSALEKLIADPDPIYKIRYEFEHKNGMKVVNKTAPFGTVLIIYESRPDVTVEAAAIAFKSGNKIVLKGGKESLNSNLKIVDLWHSALLENGLSTDWVEYKNYNRTQTQKFLQHPDQSIDLIVPRGGERLIEFVKKHARCPVIVSGRGNNFVYVDSEATLEMAKTLIINGKTAKISACNAVDKVLINKELLNEGFAESIIDELNRSNVEILGDENLSCFSNIGKIENEEVWYEEFLDYKIAFGVVGNLNEACEMINKYGGGHSAVIVTENEEKATSFMDQIDAAAVYHNASSRFTDGGQFGLGGELAISTDKLHHRGPLGLQELVTNKWYVYGNGQIR